jgi:hypothetical protein
MSSKINTGTMNMNYPLPGVNNSTQGFRDNFSSIKLNLDAAKAEIDEIQSKALLKSPLTGTSLNNDVNNNIIRNAQTLGFRSSTYNLGSNLSGTVSVDLTYGDVQYGGIDKTASGISLQFLKWAPTETYSSVQLILTVTPGQKINLPITSTTGVIYGTTTIIGFDSSTGDITVPSGVSRLHFQFNTVDCGTTIEIVPVDLGRRATTIEYDPVTPWSTSTGTITVTSGSTVVTVVGAATLPSVGAVITDTNHQVIGTILTTVGLVTINLTVAATSSYIGKFYVQQSTGNSGDIIGSMKIDDNYFYVCTGTYDGVTAIWKRTPIGTY